MPITPTETNSARSGPSMSSSKQTRRRLTGQQQVEDVGVEARRHGLLARLEEDLLQAEQGRDRSRSRPQSSSRNPQMKRGLIADSETDLDDGSDVEVGPEEADRHPEQHAQERLREELLRQALPGQLSLANAQVVSRRVLVVNGCTTWRKATSGQHTRTMTFIAAQAYRRATCRVRRATRRSR